MKNLKRLHLFEFEDLNWLPRSLRAAITDVLVFYQDKFKTYDPVAKLIANHLAVDGKVSLSDMCSGSGGAILRIKDLLQKDFGITAKVSMSDLYPNQAMINYTTQLQDEDVSYSNESFNVLTNKDSTKSCRTMFTSFHHFKPEQARQIVDNAVSAEDPIAIFEFTERSAIGFASMLIGPPLLFLMAPLMRPVNIKRLLWTYVLPMAPFVLFWDGIVSCFRTYSERELENFTLPHSNYDWKIGKIKSGLTDISYLIGKPKKA